MLIFQREPNWKNTLTLNSLIQFFLEINGFKDFDWNEHMFSIYPLERIKKEYDEQTDKDFIPFCDYLVNSHQIGLYKKNKRIF